MGFMAEPAGANHGLMRKIPVRNPDLALDGEFLWNSHGGDPVYLNSSAAVIWGLCDGSCTVGEIVELVEQAYADDDSDSVRSDVLEALVEMADQGIVQLSGNKAGTKS